MSTCTKKRYFRLRDAGLALLAMRVNHRRAEVGIHRCRECHCFHLTSDPKSATNKWTLIALRHVGHAPRDGATARVAGADRIAARG